MKFQPGISGNPKGRPRGSRNVVTRKQFAELMREMLDEHVIAALESVLKSRNHSAKMDAIRYMSEYGIGRAVDIQARFNINRSIGPGSIEYALLHLSGQPIPGQLTDGSDDMESEEGDAG